MSLPEILQTRLAALSTACGVDLRVDKLWENEFRPGWYCWFRGDVHCSPLLHIEIAGTLCVELDPARKEDEVDLFLFVNGVRVGPHDPRSKFAFKYLYRRGQDVFAWGALDEGYENVTSPDRFRKAAEEK